MITQIIPGDYYAQQNDMLVIPEGMNLDNKKKEWRKLYEKYCVGESRYVSFVDWILTQGARRATDKEIVIWEDF